MGTERKAPVLEITDGRGNLLWDASFRLLATMSYPDDPAARALYLETLLARLVVEASHSESVPRRLLAQARERTSQSEALLDRAAKEAGYGFTVAGDLLLSIITAAIHSPEDASLARSVRAWCEYQAVGRTQEGGRVAASPRAVMEAWTRFKPVAHFCAAWCLHRDFAEKSVLDPTDPSQLPNFLAVAEAIRMFGEKSPPASWPNPEQAIAADDPRSGNDLAPAGRPGRTDSRVRRPAYHRIREELLQGVSDGPTQDALMKEQVLSRRLPLKT